MLCLFCWARGEKYQVGGSSLRYGTIYLGCRGIFVNCSYPGLFLIPFYVTLFGYSENVQVVVPVDVGTLSNHIKFVNILLVFPSPILFTTPAQFSTTGTRA